LARLIPTGAAGVELGESDIGFFWNSGEKVVKPESYQIHKNDVAAIGAGNG
jgi:hypothetical protein